MTPNFFRLNLTVFYPSIHIQHGDIYPELNVWMAGTDTTTAAQLPAVGPFFNIPPLGIFFFRRRVTLAQCLFMGSL